MAKREALRELQSRLAERLQAAQSEPRGTAWLAVECAGQRLLFPLQQADASAFHRQPTGGLDLLVTRRLHALREAGLQVAKGLFAGAATHVSARMLNPRP